MLHVENADRGDATRLSALSLDPVASDERRPGKRSATSLIDSTAAAAGLRFGPEILGAPTGPQVRLRANPRISLCRRTAEN